MHELYELRELLCDELKRYGGKGELSAGSLDIVDKLAHACKNLDKVIEASEDGGYSGRYVYGDRDYRGGYRRSYARRRDSMGRYSRDGLADKLREMMEDAPDDRAKEEIRKLADKMESM